MKQNILFLLSLCIVLFSCSDKDDPIKEVEKPPVETKDPFITLKKTNIDFTNEGGSEAILIESNVTWTAKSSASWCTVTPLSGDKSTTSISLSAPANKEYDTRSSTVTIESGNITKTITVNQGENLGLLITQDRYELSNKESTIKVEVKANVEFEVEINDEWITRVEARALTTSQIEFKIAKNDTYGNRDGSITIKQKSGGMTSTITIFQSQEDAIILSEKEFELTSEAQAVEVEVKTNIDYEIIIPEDAKDWVSHSKTRALRTETVVLDIAHNKDYDERTAKIVVKDKKTNLQETVTIKQTANTGLIVSEDKYELTNDGGIIEVEVKANVEFDIEIADSWITKVETRGLTETKLQFQVAKNGNYDSRESTITIKQKGGNLSSTIKVYQSQKDAIIISEKTFVLTSEKQAIQVELKTNIEFELIISEAAKSWVSYTPTRGLRTETLTLNISENKDYTARSTEVYVKNKKTNLQDTLFINQKTNVIWVEKMGTLNTVLNQIQKDTISTMIVKGEINKADFEVMKKRMPQLRHIDLKDVQCEDDKIPFEAFGSRYQHVWEKWINKDIRTVILPSSIKTIEGSAFANCEGLRGFLDLPNGLTTIGEYAFQACYGLSGSLILPKSITSIGKSAFSYCSGFTGSLKIPDEITTIEEMAFYYCNGLSGTLSLPAGLITIKERAFYECSNFKGTLNIPDGVTTIENAAFNNCSGFNGSLKIPVGLTKIAGSVFNGCTGFTGSLTLPDGLTTIEDHAFLRCTGFTGSLIIPNGVTKIGINAFNGCTGFVGSLILPEGLTKIEQGSFWDCTGFSGSLNLPDGVTEIGVWAFKNCSGFTGSLNLPDKITYIGSEAFENCTGLNSSLRLPNELLRIENGAFKNCKNLTGTLKFPENLKMINGFAGCTGLTGSLNFPEGLKYIGSDAFTGCTGFTGPLVFPESLKSVGGFANCTGLTGSLNFPEGLEYISDKAFKNCSNISDRTAFPKSLVSLGEGSFMGCNNIVAFRFPHSVPLKYYEHYNEGFFPAEATVEVPQAAVETYQSTNGWKDYNIVGY